jgi:glutamine synthetase
VQQAIKIKNSYFLNRSKLPVLDEDADNRFENVKYELQLDTLYEVAWAGKGKHRIGEVFCEAVVDGEPSKTIVPRSLARRQLDVLHSMGYRIWSACEVEGLLTHADTQKPLFDGNELFVQEVFGSFEGLMLEVDTYLEKAGVNVSAMHPEFGSGQFEWSLEPQWGIASADKTVTLKQAIKEVSRMHGYQCWFASKVFTNTTANGCHFNHSLWDKDGKNVFLDESAENRFSKLGRHWLGGLIRHGRALCALIAPTVNCYRRFNAPFTPSHIYWQYDDRNAAFRVPTTNKTSKGPFIENRLGSGSSNTYILLAATIAAGIDGIKNEIEPPAPGCREDLERVPKNLADALNALEQDKVLREALGELFVRWFLHLKRNVELKELSDSDVTKDNEKAFAKEREMYKYL